MRTVIKILSLKVRPLLIFIFLMYGYQVGIFAQEQKHKQELKQEQFLEPEQKLEPELQVDSIRTKQHGLFVGLSVSPYQSQISQVGILSVSALNSIAKMAISGTVEIGYSLSDHFGISSGISFLSFNSQVTLKAYQNKFTTIDTEKEVYERQVTATNITEDQKIAYLGIPVNLNLRLPLGSKIGFSLRAGVDMALPVSKNYHSSGTFTYKGYYPKYNVLLENLPAYGFPDKASISADGKLELQPIYFGAAVSVGLDFFIRKNLQAVLAFNYAQSLTTLQSYSSPEKFQLSSDLNQIKSMMGGSNKVNVQSAGVIFTLRYYLTKL